MLIMLLQSLHYTTNASSDKYGYHMRVHPKMEVNRFILLAAIKPRPARNQL